MSPGIGRDDMEGSNKKRLRADEDVDYEAKQKQVRFDDVGLFDQLQSKAEKIGNDNNNNNNLLPEFCATEYSASCSSEDYMGSGIRNIAIRKQSYMVDYFESTHQESEQEEQQQQQVQPDACIGRGSLFEAAEDELWRPESPVLATEGLFCRDMMSAEELLEDSFVAGSASGFRIWEEDEKQGKDKNKDGIHFVSDWNWGAPWDQPLLSESFEFEISMPSL